MGRLVAAGARTQKMRNENANALLALRMHLGCTLRLHCLWKRSFATNTHKGTSGPHCILYCTLSMRGIELPCAHASGSVIVGNSHNLRAERGAPTLAATHVRYAFMHS